MIPKENKKMFSVLKEILDYIVIILISFIVVGLIKTYLCETVLVYGQSMAPTYIGIDENHEKGNRLIASKLPIYFNNLKRFDIIIFHEKDMDKILIKRIIGLPNETVQIKNGFIYINGELLEENYGKEIIFDAGLAEMEILLGPEEYFVLGDNRNDSLDSRSEIVGNVQKSEIEGKIILKIK